MKPATDRFFRLSVFGELRASHSLAGFETPHFHLFRVAIDFRAPFPLPGDRVIDLVLLQRQLENVLSPLQGCHLNDALGLSPTSENLCIWLAAEFERRLPAAPLEAVSVELCDLDGRAMGKARLGP
jgi:6-pyruvoyl-tetrahydropterin synthase